MAKLKSDSLVSSIPKITKSRLKFRNYPTNNLEIMSDTFLQLSKIELGEINTRSTSEASHAEQGLNAPAVEQHPSHPNQNRVEENGFGK